MNNNITYLLFIIALLIHIYTTYLTHKRIKINKYYARKPLYDIIHNNTNEYSNYSNLVDIATLIFIFPIFKSLKNDNFEPISYFISIFSILMILRSFALLATDIPSCDKNCNPHNLTLYNIFFGHCHDKLFSGHNAITILSIITAYKFKLITIQQLTLLIILQLIYAYSIIITRSHYTVDVLLSYYITIPIALLF